jgi:hypothetical protein
MSSSNAKSSSEHGPKSNPSDLRKIRSTDGVPITPTLTYKLPDFISVCQYPLRRNEHYDPVAVESENWLHAHGVHPNDQHRQAFLSCNFGLLTAYCYSEADRARFRVLCDYINCLFAFDDLTDEGGLRMDADGTRKASDIVMNALRQPYTYQTPFKIGRVFSE